MGIIHEDFEDPSYAWISKAFLHQDKLIFQFHSLEIVEVFCTIRSYVYYLHYVNIIIYTICL